MSDAGHPVLRELNVLGEPLQMCSSAPLTGYGRNGYCAQADGDVGTHVVCAMMTDAFLQFTRSHGNDLVMPSSNFPGLKAGDNWCVCALRWKEAQEAGVAPPVKLRATHASALKFAGLDALSRA